jgi:hypothetical protein
LADDVEFALPESVHGIIIAARLDALRLRRSTAKGMTLRSSHADRRERRTTGAAPACATNTPSAAYDDPEGDRRS